MYNTIEDISKKRVKTETLIYLTREDYTENEVKFALLVFR